MQNLHIYVFFLNRWIYEWSLACVGCITEAVYRFAQKGHRKPVGGSASHSHRTHSEALTNEAFRREDSGSVVNLQITCSCNFWCRFAYNYQPFVPGVRACRCSQFDTRAAAAAELYGEEWERVGGLLWNKNLISSQLGADLFVRQVFFFFFSLMSSLWFYCPLCDRCGCILIVDLDTPD